MCESFSDWAKDNGVPLLSLCPGTSVVDDLEVISASVGDAQVVGLSEGCHNSSEMMTLHHRIAKYLVENKGFTVIATESGLPESKLVSDYVQNKDMGDMGRDKMYMEGLNKMYSEWREGRDLIEWMKSYNATHDNRLHYYGVDIGGFYANWRRPLEQVIGYLHQVDKEYAVVLAGQLEPFLAVMTENARINYKERLSALEKAKLAIILDEAVEHLNKHQKIFVEMSSTDEYEWARQGMISMQLAENYYRNFDSIRDNPPGHGKYSGLNGREIAMHRNLMWILDTHQNKFPGQEVKIIWINHVIHTKTETQYQDPTWGYFTPAGQMIRQSLGPEKVFIIGLLYGGGQYWKDWQKVDKRSIASIQPSKENGLEKIMGGLGLPQCYLPWKQIPPATGLPFLTSEFTMRENDYFIKIKPMEWDAVIYLGTVNPATPY